MEDAMIKKISIDDLKPGMQVVQLSSEVWEHMPFLYSTPGVIESEDHLAEIKDQGYRHCFIETPSMEPLDKRLDALLTAREHTPPSPPRVPFEREMQVARLAYENAMLHARRIVTDSKLGRKIEFSDSMRTVETLVDSALRNPHTLVCLSKLNDYDEYTYVHCINVAAIAVVYGEYLGMEREELVHLGAAGMMHDLGKTAIPDRIINKRGRLTEQEFKEIKRHPKYGRDILARDPSVPPEVLEAVLHHHERGNGKGYPDGLGKGETSGMGRIIALADVYDALTSDRSYKDAILPNKALAIMYGMREHDFDPLEVQLFIKCLGIFPSGSLVRLNTGYYGVVYESNPVKPLMPKIKVILDEDLRPVPSKMVDLAAQQILGEDAVEILECADPAAHRINIKPYLIRKG